MKPDKTPTLLLADDQPENLQVIIQILSEAEEKYNLITVPNGKVLVEMALKKKPDLILSDWEMLEMDGIEAIGILKSNPATAHIPVIICTGVMTSSQDLKDALQSGAVDYIRKPVEPLELLARIKSMLELSASHQKIRAQNEELEYLNTLKTRILSVVSHDVRSPLNTLKGMIFLFDNQALSEEELRQIVSKMGIQVENMIEFLENLLNWSKNQLNSIQLTCKDFSLNSAIQTTIKLLSSTATSKNITIQELLPEVVSLYADEEMIKIVLRNLLSNAIKFCQPDDRIEIAVMETQEGTRVSVKDNGVGISPENIDKLFGINHLSTKGTHNEIGTGLGLLLCKQIVECHKGKIGVESQEGEGSHFWFSIPRKKH